MITAALALLALLAVAALAPTFNILLPLRPTVLTVALASIVPWPFVALSAVLGGTIGALPLYAVGRAASVSHRVQGWIHHPRAARWVRMLKQRSFVVLVLIVLLPLPDQFMVIAGVERYRLRTFLLANVIGRALLYVPLAYLGHRYQETLLTLWQQALRLLGL